MNEDKKILVLEDEESLQYAIKVKLEKNGFIVETADRVSKALSILESIEKIDAIWLDHYLIGEEDGLDFARKIKVKESRFKDVPIFVISNTASREKIESYIELGIEKYYIKAEQRLDRTVYEIKMYVYTEDLMVKIEEVLE